MFFVFLFDSLVEYFRHIYDLDEYHIESKYGQQMLLILKTLSLTITWKINQASPDHKIAAIYYFLSGVILLLVCFILYFAWPHMVSARRQTGKAKWRMLTWFSSFEEILSLLRANSQWERSGQQRRKTRRIVCCHNQKGIAFLNSQVDSGC